MEGGILTRIPRIYTDFLSPAEIAEIAEILFLADRAALSCFYHRLGLQLIVNEFPSATFQPADPFLRTLLSHPRIR